MRSPTAPSAKLQFGWIGSDFAMSWVDGNVGIISEPQTFCSQVLNWRRASQKSAYNKAARLMGTSEASGDDADINPTVFSEGIANEGKLSSALLNRIRDHHVNLLRFHAEERLCVRGI
ncbi:hypothetical protein PMI11_04739 [Rhizobium sp. CF142]|nr:hypothetical protein PMI11_04739 [Rhizobium sp. CF142]